MEDRQALVLFQEVLNKTRNGKLHWEPTASESDYLTTIRGEYSLTISKGGSENSWGNEMQGITLTVRDQHFELLTITAEVDGVGWAGLNELYELARREALRVGPLVERLMGELTKL